MPEEAHGSEFPAMQVVWIATGGVSRDVEAEFGG